MLSGKDARRRLAGLRLAAAIGTEKMLSGRSG
jgi:hypothetical protein